MVFFWRHCINFKSCNYVSCLYVSYILNLGLFLIINPLYRETVGIKIWYLSQTDRGWEQEYRIAIIAGAPRVRLCRRQHNGRWLSATVRSVALCLQQLTTPAVWRRSARLIQLWSLTTSRTEDRSNICTYSVLETRISAQGASGEDLNTTAESATPTYRSCSLVSMGLSCLVFEIWP